MQYCKAIILQLKILKDYEYYSMFGYGLNIILKIFT